MKKALYTLLLAAGAASAFAQQNKTTYAGNVMFSSVSGTDQASAPRISVAYNGDLYATAIRSDNNGAFGWELRKSTDGGATWTSLRYNGTEFLTSSFAQVEVYAAGNSSANFKVLVARSWNVVAGDGAHLVMDEYNASGVLQNNIVDENYTTSHGVVEMRIASDDRSPSGNNVPYAVSLIVDKRGPVDDSVVAFVSEDGGATWPHRQNVYNTTGLY